VLGAEREQQKRDGDADQLADLAHARSFPAFFGRAVLMLRRCCVP